MRKIDDAAVGLPADGQFAVRWTLGAVVPDDQGFSAVTVAARR
jgi:hypothetical protein